MICKDSTPTVCTSQHSGLLRLRDVVKEFNLSPTTIRRATSGGLLSCLTLPSGHRRFDRKDVLDWLGVAQRTAEEKGNGGPIPIAAVIRVSSDGQNRRVGSSDKSSLEHQEERVRAFISQRWGRQAKVEWYSRVASGLNFEPPRFLELIQDILAGKFRGGYLVATDFTRVARFATKLIEHLCKLGGCEVVYTMGDDEDKGLNETLTDEILSILTHYTAKASGQKQKALNETKMSEDKLADAYRWYKQGLSYGAIADKLDKEGRGKDEKGKQITRNVVMKRLKENWATLERLYAAEPTTENSWQEFCRKYVKKANSQRVPRKKLIRAYGQYCQREGLTVMSSKAIAKYTKEWARIHDSKGATVFVGLTLKS